MVRVLGKDKDMFKHASCQYCGSKLEYLPSDIMKGYHRESDTKVIEYLFIECPSCWERVVVNV